MQEMNNRLTDQSELQSKIRTLENKLKTTEENCDEYMKKYKEAIVALKEIKEAVFLELLPWGIIASVVFVVIMFTVKNLNPSN